jgi:hypothetical protein
VIRAADPCGSVLAPGSLQDGDYVIADLHAREAEHGRLAAARI